jgi:serine/threonine protein kinase
MTPPFDPPIDLAELSVLFPALRPIRPIGEGGQAPVFLVQLPDGTQAALKIFPLRNTTEKRVSYEINALQRLDSENLVRFYDFGNITVRNEDCLFVVYEFIDGENVHDMIVRGPFDAHLVKSLIHDIAAAVDKLWELRIVHRDIKPENIMISQPSNKAVLIDLGIAKHLNESTLTATGLVWGTLGYMSPEQFRGQQRLSLKSDIFSLGLVAYEAYAGTHPFARSQPRVMTDTPTPIASIRQVDFGLETLIMSMLDKDPVRRPTAKMVITMLSSQ